MKTAESTTAKKPGRITDARGRNVRQLDPVKLHLLNLPSVIPPEALRTMADEILPGARRQRLIQLLSLAAALILIVGGNIIYFQFFSTWKGFDGVNTSLYIVQFIVVVSGPVLAYRQAKAAYAAKVGDVMLRHRHCPHCGYDIRSLPRETNDGTTICPECGCAWKLEH